ncbi:glycerol-3-phosphate dehydrogenase [Stenotrophomonas rhizophila]|nr:glycerol-3-phosphate dehydrogenase [Stenotrophomonas rhizophila]
MANDRQDPDAVKFRRLAYPQPQEIHMAFPTAVNDQITDSVTQANTKVLGDAPAIAMGNLYQATAQALANAAHNATNAQQQSYVTAQSATTMGVATLYSIDTASTAVATKEILSTGVRGLG